MQIQSATTMLPVRATTTRPSQENPPCEQDPSNPNDGFEPGGWQEAAVAVGKSTLRGAMEGIGWSYLAFLGQAAGGPAVGLATRVAILGVGAAIGYQEKAAQFEQITGSETLGKVMGAVSGAGRHMLYIGSSPVDSLNGAIIRGGLMGGFLGVLETPRS